MEISGVSTSLHADTLYSSKARAEVQPAAQSKTVAEARHEHSPGGRGRRGLALGIFRQELRMALQVQFHAKFAAGHPYYDDMMELPTSGHVAQEALGAAKQLVAESPTTAAKSLISFRAKIVETASYVRDTAGVQDDIDEIDDTVARVDSGLAKLEDEVAANRKSSASVLDVDTRTKQRSTIQIRTQEGDVVKLSLKRMDSLSATDVAVAEDNMFVSSTEVEVSSRSRMRVRVEGDLNESELAAIQNVFAQAQLMADEFFGGDIGAAFNLAAGFEFDTEQLARVNMRFRMRQVTNVAYSEVANTPKFSPIETQPVMGPESVSAPLSEERPAGAVPVTVVPAEIEVEEQPVAREAESKSQLDTSALSSFFNSLSAFLRSVGDGFEEASGSGSFKYHYSETFKLNLLKAVMHTVAPDESGDAAAAAETLIDNISGGESDN